jgi:hypothetical protein
VRSPGQNPVPRICGSLWQRPAQRLNIICHIICCMFPPICIFAQNRRASKQSNFSLRVRLTVRKFLSMCHMNLQHARSFDLHSFMAHASFSPSLFRRGSQLCLFARTHLKNFTTCASGGEIGYSLSVCVCLRRLRFARRSFLDNKPHVTGAQGNFNGPKQNKFSAATLVSWLLIYYLSARESAQRGAAPD